MNLIHGVIIPRITSLEMDIQAEGGRAIRTWRMTASYATYEQGADLAQVAMEHMVTDLQRSVAGVAHVRGGAAVSLQLAEWPPNESVMVYILAGGYRDRRTSFMDPSTGIWHKYGRIIDLEVVER